MSDPEVLNGSYSRSKFVEYLRPDETETIGAVQDLRTHLINDPADSEDCSIWMIS